MYKNSNYFDKVIFHELGHWISAKNLGFTTGEIFIRIEASGPDQKNWGHKAYSYSEFPVDYSDNEMAWIKKRLVVLSSGVAAQVGIDQRERDAIFEKDAPKDDQRLNDISRQLILLESPNSVNASVREIEDIRENAWQHALKIIHGHNLEISHLADRIKKKVILTWNDYRIELSEIEDWLSEISEINSLMSS